MVEIRKDRKYIVQFPEGTSVEAQTIAVNKMEESLKSEDRFTVVDPRIKFIKAEDVTETVETPVADAVKDAEAAIETPAVETPAVETPAPVVEPVAEGVKVETVVSETPAVEEPKGGLLDESGSSS